MSPHYPGSSFDEKYNKLYSRQENKQEGVLSHLDSSVYCVLCPLRYKLCSEYCLLCTVSYLYGIWTVYYKLCYLNCVMWVMYCKRSELCTVYCILYTVAIVLCFVSYLLCFVLSWVICTGVLHYEQLAMYCVLCTVCCKLFTVYCAL